MLGADQFDESCRGHFAAGILWSLLGHACIVLALVIPRPVPITPEVAREIPVEVVMTWPPHLEGLAVSAKTAVVLERPAKGAGAWIEAIAPLGATLPARGRNRQQNLQGLAPHPAGSGQDGLRVTPILIPGEMGSEALGYQLIVGGMLERAKRYPESARGRGAKGAAAIGFELDTSGFVAAVSLLRSSGEPDLDSEGMELVSRAAPFPPPPPGAKRTFVIEIAFGKGKRAQPLPLQ
ncbi:MAG: TonB family protein [Beijerinckiaceae bacterium]|nr:TonB family protein [Beijerinckiaceae bacterium]